MNHAVIHHYDTPVTIAQVREIGTAQVWNWLAAGWKDIQAAPGRSLAYGVALAVASYLITLGVIASGLYFLIPLLLAGFFLVAPQLGIGLYEISRQLEAGEPPSWQATLQTFRENGFNLLTMGVILVVAMIAWMGLAQMVVALTYTGITPATW